MGVTKIFLGINILTNYIWIAIDHLICYKYKNIKLNYSNINNIYCTLYMIIEKVHETSNIINIIQIYLYNILQFDDILFNKESIKIIIHLFISDLK